MSKVNQTIKYLKSVWRNMETFRLCRWAYYFIILISARSKFHKLMIQYFKNGQTSYTRQSVLKQEIFEGKCGVLKGQFFTAQVNSRLISLWQIWRKGVYILLASIVTGLNLMHTWQYWEENCTGYSHLKKKSRN